MLNRHAVILKYREPMVRWINEADPHDDDPGITAESLRQERTVYLIPAQDMDCERAAQEWVEANYSVLFEEELNGWYTDPELWPQDRSLRVFREWFEVEFHGSIVDTVGGDVHDDGT